MKRKTKQFMDSSINSLLLSIELFNRPYENGRNEGVLISLDHALEMLMKAIIYDITGKIRDSGDEFNYNFKKCVKKLRFTLHIIDENQKMTLNTIGDLRNSAMHDIIFLSEDSLYLHAQSGITLFNDLLKSQFSKTLRDYLPERVLPISTNPPTNIDVFFDEEFSQINELIAPGKRKIAEASARLRPLMILENNITDEEKPTTDYEVNKVIRNLKTGKTWKELFPGAANLKMDSTGSGLTYSIRLTKNEGLPVRTLGEGEDASKAIAYRIVNPLDQYNLSITKLAKKIGITVPKACALVEYLEVKKDEKYYREIKIDKSSYPRYSPNLIPVIQQKINDLDMTEVWQMYKAKHYTTK